MGRTCRAGPSSQGRFESSRSGDVATKVGAAAAIAMARRDHASVVHGCAVRRSDGGAMEKEVGGGVIESRQWG